MSDVVLTVRNMETGEVEEITMPAGTMVQVAVCPTCRRPLEYGECFNCPRGRE